MKIEPNKRLLRRFSTEWQKVIIAVFDAKISELGFPQNLKFTLETGTVFNFKNCLIHNEGKDILVLTEHDGYYIFSSASVKKISDIK